jgi:hypothetical protein
MDPALRLGHRHSLHAMHARLVLHAAVGIAALDPEHDVLEPAHLRRRGGKDLGLPFPSVGQMLIHLVEVARPQRRFLTARPRSDLHDQILAVVGVLRHEQLLQPAAERSRASRRGTRFLVERLRHLGVGFRGGELARLRGVRGCLPELAVRPDDLVQLGEELS